MLYDQGIYMNKDWYMAARFISWQSLLDMGWLFFLLFIFAYFWLDRRVMLETRLWMKTKGRVTECEWTTHGHSIWPKVEYVYQVNDEEFTGEYLFPDTSHNDPNSAYARRIAYKAANAYKLDEDVDVYYNPDLPSQSALDITMPRKLTFILWFIAALIVLHLVISGVRLFS